MRESASHHFDQECVCSPSPTLTASRHITRASQTTQQQIVGRARSGAASKALGKARWDPLPCPPVHPWHPPIPPTHPPSSGSSTRPWMGGGTKSSSKPARPAPARCPPSAPSCAPGTKNCCRKRFTGTSTAETEGRSQAAEPPPPLAARLSAAACRAPSAVSSTRAPPPGPVPNSYVSQRPSYSNTWWGTGGRDYATPSLGGWERQQKGMPSKYPVQRGQCPSSTCAKSVQPCATGPPLLQADVVPLVEYCVHQAEL